jgi:uncharacterized protein (DUF427 family)
MKAYSNDTLIADSDNTIQIEGNEYFPPESIKKEYFKESDHHTVCPWKGRANYYDLEIDGDTNNNAAWYYPDTLPKAEHFKNYVAFWKDVKVVDE